MWVSLILALISFFVSKKNGASSTEAALTAAAVGAGTYYVTTQTDWGKSTLGGINDSIADLTGTGYVDPAKDATYTPEQVKPLVGADGKPVLDAAGNPLYEPIVGSVVPRNPDGSVKVESDGSIVGALVTGVTGVLKSWGGAGTAAVIGTTAVATSDSGITGFLKDNALLIGGAILAFMLLK